MACEAATCVPFVSKDTGAEGPAAETPADSARAALLTGDLVHEDKKHTVTLTQASLSAACAARQKSFEVDLDDVYGVQPHPKQAAAFVVYSMPLKRRTRFERSKKTHTFVCDSAATASQWIAAIRAVLAGVPVGTQPIPQRRIYVIINPVGGTRTAKSIYEKQVAPLFAIANVCATVKFTERSLHATELTRDLNLSEYDAIATVSGDGLLHEAINGLFLRSDWHAALRTPVGIIPAGSGNGLGRSVETPEPALAAFSVIKGHTRPFDIMSTSQAGEVKYGHLCFYWGIFADVDIESEKYRWAGPARFTFSALARMSTIRKYRGKLSYLPWRQAAAEGDIPAYDGERPPSPAVLPGQPLPEGWETIETEFVSIVGMNAGWAAKDLFVAPYSHIHDGAIDITYVRADEATSSKLLSMFLEGESGEMSKHPIVHYLKVRAFVLEPLCTPPGILDLDGERIRDDAIAIESHRGLARILCPKRLNLPVHPVPEAMARVKDVEPITAKAAEPDAGR